MSNDPTPPEPTNPELLSLDDAEQLPATPEAAPTRNRWWYIPLSLILTGITVFVVYFGFVALRGSPEGLDWYDFKPPDGNCTVHMPRGALEAEPDLSGRSMVKSARMFRLNRLIWPRRLTCEFGWYDLGAASAGETDLVRLADRERDSLKDQHGGRVLREGVVKLDQYNGREIVIQNDEEFWVSRLILDPDQHRVYLMTLGGSALQEGSPVIGRFFNSLRIEAE